MRSGISVAERWYTELNREYSPCGFGLDGGLERTRVMAKAAAAQAVFRLTESASSEPTFGLYITQYQGGYFWTVLGYVCPEG